MSSRNIIVVNSYINNEEKRKVLLKYLKQLKLTGNDILLTSHTPIDDDILQEVDYYIYDKENFLLPIHLSPITWFADENEYVNMYSCRHGYAIIKNVYLAINFLYRINKYEKFLFTEYDNDISDTDIPKINQIFKTIDENHKKLFIFYLSNQKFNFGHVLHQTGMFAGDIQFFKENVPLVKSFDEWCITYPFANNNDPLESIFVRMTNHVKDQIYYFHGQSSEYFNNSIIDLFQIFDQKYSIVYNIENPNHPLIFLYSNMGQRFEILIDNSTVFDGVISKGLYYKHYFDIDSNDKNIRIKVNGVEKLNKNINITTIEQCRILAERGVIPKVKNV